MTPPTPTTGQWHGLRMLRVFLDSPPLRRAMVVGCLLVGTLAESIGLATLLPLLTVGSGEQIEGGSSLQQAVVDTLAFFGLPATLEVLVLVVLAGMVLRAVLTLAATAQVGYAVAEVTTHLRLALIQALLNARWGYFARQPVGRFANAISGEATRAGDAFLSAATFIVSAIQAAVFFGLALLISWWLAVLSLVVGLLIVLAFGRFIRQSRKAGRQQTKRTKQLVMRLTDTLISIKPLKTMARHHTFGRLFAVEVRELEEAMRAQVFSKQATKSLSDPIIGVFLVLGFYVALKYAQMPLAELLVMGLFVAKVMDTIGKVQQSYQSLVLAESAYTSIRGAIDEAEHERETWAGTATPTLQTGCSFHNLSFAFPGKTVVREISLEIPAGRVTTLTGISGAGKTTIADLLLGLYRPNLGEIRVDGVPLGDIDLMKWRRMVGYVPQEVILFHDTIYNNVTLGDPAFSREDAQQALEAAGLWDFVAGLPEGLDRLVGERGTLLSGGQRQRIAVARALVHGPSLLILDEATSALDPQTEAAICANLVRLARARGLTILAVSHQASWVEAADRVYHVGQHSAVLVRDAGSQARA